MWEAVLYQAPDASGQMVWAALHYVRDTFATMGACEWWALQWAEPGSIRICERIVI